MIIFQKYIGNGICFVVVYNKVNISEHYEIITKQTQVVRLLTISEILFTPVDEKRENTKPAQKLVCFLLFNYRRFSPHNTVSRNTNKK